MSETTPSNPNIEATVVEYDRADGSHVAQQRFYEVSEDGHKHQLKNVDARDTLAPQMENLFNSMAQTVASPSPETTVVPPAEAPGITENGMVNYDAFSKFGEVFRANAEKHAQKTANEVMDLAVIHSDIFAKMPTVKNDETRVNSHARITPEENQVLTDLTSKYGPEIVDTMRKVSRGLRHADEAIELAESKIAQIEKMKRARGAGADVADLDSRISKLNDAITKSRDHYESTRNAIYRQQVERSTYKDSYNRLQPPYEFWGFEEKDQKPAKQNVVADPKTDREKALDAEAQKLTSLRDTYARLSAEARQKSFKGRHSVKVEQAREAYEKKLDTLGSRMAEFYREKGASRDDIKVMAIDALCAESVALSEKIGEERELLAGAGNRRSRLAELWVKTGSKDGKMNVTGTAIRALGMAGAGILAGTGVGAIGAGAWAAVTAGGTLSGALATRINHKRAGVNVSQKQVRAADGSKVTKDFTLAAEQALAEAQESTKGLKKYDSQVAGQDIYVHASDITKQTEKVTENTRRRNAKRIGYSVVAGALGSQAGLKLATGVLGLGGAGSKGSTEGSTTTSTTTTIPGPVYTAAEQKFIKGVNLLHDRYPNLKGQEFMSKVNKTAAYMLELSKKGK